MQLSGLEQTNKNNLIDLEDKYAKMMNYLNQTYTVQIASMETNFSSHLLTMEDGHEQTIKDLQDQNRKNLSDIENLNAINIESLKLFHKESIEKI